MNNNDFDKYVEYEMNKNKRNTYLYIILGIGAFLFYMYYQNKLETDLKELDKANTEFKSAINEYKTSVKRQNKYLLNCEWCGNSFDGRYGWTHIMGIISQCDLNVNPKNWAFMSECSRKCATEHLRSIRRY